MDAHSRFWEFFEAQWEGLATVGRADLGPAAKLVGSEGENDNHGGDGRESACISVPVWEIDGEKRQKRKEERSCQSELVISGVEVSPSSLSTLSAHTYGSQISQPLANIRTHISTQTRIRADVLGVL